VQAAALHPGRVQLRRPVVSKVKTKTPFRVSLPAEDHVVRKIWEK